MKSVGSANPWSVEPCWKGVEGVEILKNKNWFVLTKVSWLVNGCERGNLYLAPLSISIATSVGSLLQLPAVAVAVSVFWSSFISEWKKILLCWYILTLFLRLHPPIDYEFCGLWMAFDLPSHRWAQLPGNYRSYTSKKGFMIHGDDFWRTPHLRKLLFLCCSAEVIQ